MPEIDVMALNPPRWIAVLNALGMIALLVAVAAIVFVQSFEPQLWMARVAQGAAYASFLLFVPHFVTGMGGVLHGIWRWKRGLIARADHEVVHFGELRRWLLGFPREQLDEHHRFAKLARERMTSKLGIISGGVERLGVLPLATALFLLAREAHGIGIEGLIATPPWLAMLALFLAVGWAIGAMAAQMRMQYEFYEMILADALAARDARDASAD